MAWFATLISLLAFILYAVRSGELMSGQVHGERVARLGIGLVLVSLVTGFGDVAVTGEPFRWRHWFVLVGLLVSCAGYSALLMKRRR